MIKRQGFTLAEALITLVIMSLVMAATIPVIIKSKNSPSESPFKYVTMGDLVQNAAVYSAIGNTSTVVLGDKRVPIDKNIASSDKDYVFASRLNPKLSIITRNRTNNPLISRHLLDFYEKEDTNNYSSIGKLSFDRYFNLSLGLNALDSMKSADSDTQKYTFDAATDTNGYDWSELKFSGGSIDTTASLGAANTAVGQYSMAGDARYYKMDGSTEYPSRNFIGIGNTALGAFSMRRHQTGNFNTAIGTYSLQSASNSQDGSVIYSADDIGAGNYNTAIGAYTLKYNSKGSYNIAAGTFALQNNITGNTNTAMGHAALKGNETGAANIGIGYSALIANTIGTRNTVVGTASLKLNTEGWNNIVIGYDSLNTNTTGNGNIYIGNSLVAENATNSNKLYLGGKYNADHSVSYNTASDILIYGDMDARTLKMHTTEVSLGIDNASVTKIYGTGYICSVEGGTETTRKIATIDDIENYIANVSYNAGTGIVSYTAPATTYSDARLKNIINDNTSGLKEILQIQVKNYTMKRDKKKEVLVGVIAQELQKVFPNSVSEGRDGYLRIRRDEIFYACVNAIKELHTMIQDVIAKITGLEQKIRILEDKNKLNEEKITSLERQNKIFEERLKALENAQQAEKSEKTILKRNQKDSDKNKTVDTVKTETVAE